MNRLLLLILCTFSLSMTSSVAEATPRQGLSVLTGLSQSLLLGGGNLAVDYVTGPWLFEYSHGWGLKLNKVDSILTADERSEGLIVDLPWTTGGGVGYHLTETIVVAVELKAHHYSVTSPTGSNKTYTTYSAGPAIYYNLRLSSNLFLQPVLRYWPNVASSEPGNTVTFTRADGSSFEHKLHDQGLFGNVSLGWSF